VFKIKTQGISYKIGIVLFFRSNFLAGKQLNLSRLFFGGETAQFIKADALHCQLPEIPAFSREEINF